MKRERMNVWEAGAFLAERPLEAVDIKSPFPRAFGRVRLKTADPEVKRWVSRVRLGTQNGTLSCYRNPDDPRGQAYYREDDLKRWFLKVFPRQEARF